VSATAPSCHIDPDQFLNLGGSQPISPEAGRAAWTQAYARLAQRLAVLGGDATLYVVMGLQGAGKSTWVARKLAQSPARTIYFCGRWRWRRRATPATAATHASPRPRSSMCMTACRRRAWVKGLMR